MTLGVLWFLAGMFFLTAAAEPWLARWTLMAVFAGVVFTHWWWT